MAPKKKPAAWKDPKELKPLEDPTHSNLWHAEPGWNKLALLAQAWKLVVKGLKP